MDDTLKLPRVSDRDQFYYRQRSKNRLFESITAFFAEEVERRGITQRDISESLGRDPAQISRLLSAPSNLTNDTVSDFLLSLGAEMDYRIVRFDDRPIVNEMHPLIAKILGYSQFDFEVEHYTPEDYQRLTRTSITDQSSRALLSTE